MPTDSRHQPTRPRPDELAADDARLALIVRDAGTISRGELTRRAGLSRAAVAARVEALIERGLLVDAGQGPSTGGRPPTLVRFADDGGHVVAVDLGATSVDVAITTLRAEPVGHHAEPIDVRIGPEKTLGRVSEIVAQLLAEHELGVEGVRGLGIGLPGPVEFDAGRPVSPPIMPGWDQYPVREHFEASGIGSVYVDNDANVMALGEGWGSGDRLRNYLWIKLGTGIGCGIVIDGRVYRGADGCAGDIGHIAVGGSEVPCRCGHTGCLEAIAGGYALPRTAEALARAGGSTSLARILAERGTLEAADLATALAEGDLGTIGLVRSAGTAIGEVLAALVNFYNPQQIIIGGGVAEIGDLLLAAIREAVYRRSLPLATRDISIAKSTLGPRAGVVGAAAMVLGERYGLTPAIA